MSNMDAPNTFSPRRNNSSNGLSTPALDDHSLQAEGSVAGMLGLIAALSGVFAELTVLCNYDEETSCHVKKTAQHSPVLFGYYRSTNRFCIALYKRI